MSSTLSIHLRMLLLVMLTLVGMPIVAQTLGNTEVRRGNSYYRDSLYREAEVMYRKALEQNRNNNRAHFNLGNALLRQGKPQDAYKAYEEAVKNETNDFIKSKSYHNMGVIFQSQKKYKEAIEQYKASLRLNPSDDDTRYNLVLCQKMLDKNPPQDNRSNQSSSSGGNNDQNQNDNSQQNKQDEQRQSMSEDNVEQLLRMVQQAEKDVQRRVNENKEVKGGSRYNKRW